MDLPNSNGSSALRRRNSSDTDEWVIVNAQGTEIDNFSCQTGIKNVEMEVEAEPDVGLSDDGINSSVEVDLVIQNSCNNEKNGVEENVLEIRQQQEQHQNVEENVSLETLIPFSSPELPDSNIENEENINLETGLEEAYDDGSIAESTSSSSCPSDISLVNNDDVDDHVTAPFELESLQNDENERRVVQPDVALETAVNEDSTCDGSYLPFFVNISDWRKFYMSCALASIGVVLLFASCLSRFDKQIDAITTDQAATKMLMQRCKNDVTDLRRQIAACKMSSNEFCEREDKPSCYEKEKNLQFDETCKRNVEQMDAYAKQFDMEHKILMNEIQTLQSNMTNFLLSYSNLFLAERLETVRLRRSNALRQAGLKYANLQNSKSEETESTLRRLLAQLETRANYFRDEFAKSDSERKRYESLYLNLKNRQEKSTTTNFDELLNLTNSLWNGRILPTFRQFYENVQKNVDQTAKSADFEQYLHKFKSNVVDHVGSTVTSFWQKAKDVSKTLRDECVKKSSTIDEEFVDGASSYCNLLYPFVNVVDDESESGFSSNVEDDTVEIHEQDNIFDDDEDDRNSEDQGISDDENVSVEDTYDPTTTPSPAVITNDFSDVNTLADVLPIVADDDEEASTMFVDGAEEEAASTMFVDDEILVEKFAKQVKKFRNALKSSTEFHRSVDEDDAERYVDTLKRLFKTSSSRFVDDASWWFCQKVWWSGGRDADCPSSTTLLLWQQQPSSGGIGGKPKRSILTHHKRRQILAGTKSLADVVDEFVDEQRRKSFGDKRRDADARWFFERYRSRRRQRDDERRGFESSAWQFARSKERDESRKVGDRKADYKKGDASNSKQHHRRRRFQWGYENYF